MVLISKLDDYKSKIPNSVKITELHNTSINRGSCLLILLLMQNIVQYSVKNGWLFLMASKTLGITILSPSSATFSSRTFPTSPPPPSPPTVPDLSTPLYSRLIPKLTNISSAPVLLGNPADDVTTIVLLLFFIFVIVQSFRVPRSPHVYPHTNITMRTKIRVGLFISLSCVVCTPIGQDFWK